MKILFETNLPSPYRVDFFNALGVFFDLTVVIEGKNASNRNQKWLSEKATNFEVIYLDGLKYGEEQFFSLKFLSLLNKKWDLIILGDYSTPTSLLAIEYLRIRDIPFAIEADGGLIAKESWIKRKIKKHFISAAQWWFTSGKVTTEYLCYYGAKEKNCFEYPFTSLKERDFDIKQDFDKAFLKNKLGIKEDFIIISVGRFSYNGGYGKGYDYLLNVSNKLPKDIGIYIIGDEPTETFIKWKAEKELTNVHFVGFKAKDELNEYYRVADLFVLMTRYDVWGLVINEAMLHGLPIITTNMCVAGKELVDDKGGFLIQLGDLNSLKDKILYYYYNPSKVLAAGKHNKDKIKKYTIENMALEHQKIIIKILNEEAINRI